MGRKVRPLRPHLLKNRCQNKAHWHANGGSWAVIGNVHWERSDSDTNSCKVKLSLYMS